MEKGESIASEEKGDYMFVEGAATDLRGNSIPNATIDTHDNLTVRIERGTWLSRETPFNRRWFIRHPYSGVNGLSFSIQPRKSHDLSRPNSYPVPNNGIVGKMLSKLGRHVFRPAHLHIRDDQCSWRSISPSKLGLSISSGTRIWFIWRIVHGTLLEKHIMSDAVFGVNWSLIVVGFSTLCLASCLLHFLQNLKVINDLSRARGFKEAKPHVYLKQNFVLATVKECVESRRLVQTDWLSVFLTCISC